MKLFKARFWWISTRDFLKERDSFYSGVTKRIVSLVPCSLMSIRVNLVVHIFNSKRSEADQAIQALHNTKPDGLPDVISVKRAKEESGENSMVHHVIHHYQMPTGLVIVMKMIMMMMMMMIMIMMHGVQEQTLGQKKLSRLLTRWNVFTNALATYSVQKQKKRLGNIAFIA